MAGVPPVGSPITRALFVALGTISLGLGIIGIVLPLVPTTPFLLLSAACYARGSTRLHDRLVSHPKLGPYIERWNRERTVPRRAKILAVVMVWTSLGLSAWLVASAAWHRILILAVGVALTGFLMSLRTRARPATRAKPQVKSRTP